MANNKAILQLILKIIVNACHNKEKENLVLIPTDRPDLINCYYDPLHQKVKFVLPNATIDESQIKSIWLRRLVPPNFSHFDKKVAEYCTNEYREFYEGVEYILPDVLWVSKPSSINRARNKSWQLIVAKELGFNVPETIFTNSPQAMVDFCQNKKAVYKSIKSPRISITEEKNITVFTTVIDEQASAFKDGLMSCPGIIQNFCDKEADIRVSVFKNKVFAVKIESQQNDNSKIDFRAGARYVPQVEFALPEEISDWCVQIVSKLDLLFGAIDLLLMKDGSFIFLEINPNGQWGWLEEKTGMPMRRALIDLLFKD